MNNVLQTQKRSLNKKITNEINEWLILNGADSKKFNPFNTLCNLILKRYKDKIGHMRPPIDLNELSEYFNIKKIFFSSQINNCDALLIPVKDGFNIKLKKIKVDNSNKIMTSRIRFSCAHEMMHTLFYIKKKGFKPKRAISGHSEYEEQICNIGASELLMPLDIFNKRLKKYTKTDGANCNTIKKLGSTFNTSLQSISKKVLEQTKSSAWDDKIIMRVDPIEKNDNNINDGFKIKWYVLPENQLVNEYSFLIDGIKINNPLYEILEDETEKYKKIVERNYENKYYIDEVPILISPLNIIQRGFLIIFPLSEYVSIYNSRMSKINKHKIIILNFNFKTNKNDTNYKKKVIVEKLDITRYL